MSNRKIKYFIIGSLTFYFGWLLSFPFYGPVYFSASPQMSFMGLTLVMLFVGAHTITHFVVGFTFRQEDQWYKIMTVSLGVTLVTNILFMLDQPWLWVIGMVILGIASSLYTIGWSILFSLTGQTQERIKIMVIIMISSNLVLLFFTLLKNALPSKVLLGLTNLPLIITCIVLVKSGHFFEENVLSNYVKLPISKPLLLLFSLFVFSIYLNGGLMYSIMLPALSAEFFMINYYPFVVYVFVLLVIYRLYKSVNSALLIYIGMSVLGLAFITFALFNHNTSGYLLTIGFMESSFALIDLFLWTTLCILAFVYGAPFQIFGILLGANTASIFIGDLIGKRLIHAEDNLYFVTALLSATSILLAIIVIPWLMQSFNHKFELFSQEDSSRIIMNVDTPIDILMAYLPNGKTITDRETEVIHLVLQGMTNKEIARQLFITDHTVKTHMKNICNKFGVSRKKELIYLATRKE
ncbi:conserved membrane protein of unknown function [Petrocella atlantisensis]|uniref:HTH luxR-type domain-containing protein n=2 Tax=Petrocella atlantisensis TaxID=2173034 RepID=A0A3P7PJ61_9FIRM|nr:conserved membrane protein of unknown function [Petrocella atlantisensis]